MLWWGTTSSHTQKDRQPVRCIWLTQLLFYWGFSTPESPNQVPCKSTFDLISLWSESIKIYKYIIYTNTSDVTNKRKKKQTHTHRPSSEVTALHSSAALSTLRLTGADFTKYRADRGRKRPLGVHVSTTTTVVGVCPVSCTRSVHCTSFTPPPCLSES